MEARSTQKQSVVIFTGYPATGKTTSAYRVYLQLLKKHSVSLVSTLSIRQAMGGMNDLHSGELRRRVYKKLWCLVENELRENNQFVIIDGNFNKKERLRRVNEIARKFDADVYFIDCIVSSKQEICRRLEYRKTQGNNVQHKASIMDLYYLIKNESDLHLDDLLQNENNMVLLKFNTEKGNLTVENKKPLDEYQNQIFSQICLAILLENRENTNSESYLENRAMRKKAVIFDIGGVIQPFRWEKVRDRIIDIKPSLSIDEIRNAIYNKRRRFFNLYETSMISGNEFWSMVSKEIDLPKQYNDRLREAFSLLLGDIDEIIMQLIVKLKEKYSLFALSNSCPEIESELEKRKEFYKCFKKVYLSHQIGYKKPNIESFEHVLVNSGFAGNECIFIDDIKDNVIASEKLGITGILFTTPERLLTDLKRLEVI